MAGRRHATASSVHPPVILIVSTVSAAPTYLASQLQSSRRAPGLIYACGDLATLAEALTISMVTSISFSLALFPLRRRVVNARERNRSLARAPTPAAFAR